MLNLWKNKDVEGILNETRMIQKKGFLNNKKHKHQKENLKHLLNLFFKEKQMQ